MELIRTVKDTVFTHLFSIAKYRKLLYLQLHPEDIDITEDEVEPKTIERIFTSGNYNDVGLLIRNRLLIFVEAQSTWSINILVRLILYLAETYKHIIVENGYNIYGSKKVILPRPEFYVVYTGDKKLDNNEISLSSEFFDGKSDMFDLKVKIITENESKKFLKNIETYGILYEYIEFTRIFNMNRAVEKDGIVAITKTINECIEKNILREYMIEHREEVMSIMEVLYDQDWVTKCYEKELREDAIAEGRAIGIQQGIQLGIQQGMVSAIVKLIKEKLITVADGAKQLGMSEEDLRAKMLA